MNKNLQIVIAGVIFILLSINLYVLPLYGKLCWIFGMVYALLLSYLARLLSAFLTKRLLKDKVAHIDKDKE